MHVPLWHGLRVVAADASKMQMFLQDATGRSVRETVAFALYLPSQEMTLAASMNLQWLSGIRADACGFSAVKSFLHSGQTEAVVTYV